MIKNDSPVLINIRYDIHILLFLYPIGIDLFDIMNLGQEIANHDDIARKSKVLHCFIKTYQDCLTALEKVLLYFINTRIIIL